MRLFLNASHWFLPLILLAQASSSRSDDALKRRVQEEYPIALAKLEARYGTMHGQADFEEIFSQSDKVPRTEKTAKVDFAFAGNSSKVSSTSTKSTESHQTKPVDQLVYQSVHGLNPDYCFYLLKRQAGDEFVLKRVSDDLTQGWSDVLRYHGGEVRAPISIDHIPVSLLWKEKRFQIDDVVEETVADGPKRLKIQFTVKRPADEPILPPNGFNATGWVVVSPEEGWIIREYYKLSSRNGAPANTRIGKIEYARSPDGHLDPVKYTQMIYRGRALRENPGDPLVSHKLILKSMKFEALPESEFRLPAFGIPEVETGKKGASTARPYWIFALAIVGFGVAGGLKYLSSRMKRS